MSNHESFERIARNSTSGPFPLRVIGTTADFDSIRLGSEIELAVFTTTSELTAVPRDCPAFSSSCRFMLLEDIHNIQGLWARTRTIDAIIGFEIRRNLRSWQNRLLKRMFDILLAIPLGLLAPCRP
jgi:hypothetical protein